MKNIILNIFKGDYIFIILKKVLKRFEKDTSYEASKWAKENAKFSTDEFCNLVDQTLYDEILLDVKSIEKEANYKLSKLNVILGGCGNFILLYFLARKIKPKIIVETGVAAGWSSLAILRAIAKNGTGKLYSSDFPYFRLKNPEQYVGYLAKSEINNADWFLDIRGDDVAIPEIYKRIGEKNIDLFHYDSDKSYSGRKKVFKKLFPKFHSKTIMIFDDIQDNLHFKELTEKTDKDYCIIEFNGKYLGIIGINFLLEKNLSMPLNKNNENIKKY